MGPRHVAAALIACGVLGRLFAYLRGAPFWHDESWLAENLVSRDFLGLTRQLDHKQVAPLLFLWAESVMVRLFGPTELALRAIPLAAGIASIFVFRRIAWRILPTTAAVAAIGLLSLSQWPIQLSVQVKPYSLDLLVALAILAWTTEYLFDPERHRPLVWLSAAIVPLMGMSFPVVFVAGGAGLVLLVIATRRRDPHAAKLVVLFNLLLVIAFALFHLGLGRRMVGDQTGDLNSYMLQFWARGFPPAEPAAWPEWLLRIHTSWLVAYPFGNTPYVNATTFVAALAGAVILARSPAPRAILGLLLVPFGLNFVAAAMHRYPYGGCCRLSQHLAPAVCLLAATGTAAIVDRFGLRRVAAIVLALGGLVTVAKPLVQSPRPTDAWAKATAFAIAAEHGPRPLTLLTDPGHFDPVLRWYLTAKGISLVAPDSTGIATIAMHYGPAPTVEPDADDDSTARFSYRPSRGTPADVRTVVVRRVDSGRPRTP